MNILGLLLSLIWQDAGSLSSEQFDVRQNAEWRLSWCGPLALPALLWANTQPDLEQKRRAERVLTPLRKRGERIGITLLAMWLFYGPDESLSSRYLTRNRAFVEYMPDWMHYRLRDEAVRFGLLEYGTGVYLEPSHRCGWINLMRHRAYNVPSPTTH